MIRLLFDGPPGPECGRFVESEDENGKSINAGEWSQQGEYWVLTIPGDPELKADRDRLQAELAEARKEVGKWRSDYDALAEVSRGCINVAETDRDALKRENDALSEQNAELNRQGVRDSERLERVRKAAGNLLTAVDDMQNVSLGAFRELARELRSDLAGKEGA